MCRTGMLVKLIIEGEVKKCYSLPKRVWKGKRRKGKKGRVGWEEIERRKSLSAYAESEGRLGGVKRRPCMRGLKLSADLQTNVYAT